MVRVDTLVKRETSIPKPLVQDGDLSIRRMRDDLHDYRLMSGWLTDERGLKFYEGRDNPYDIARVRRKYGPRARGEDPVVPCILVYSGSPIGYLQYYPVLDRNEYGVDAVEDVYAIDLFIGEPGLWDQGIGTRALSLFVDYLFRTTDAVRILIDPQTWNRRAIRCYEKCGFRKIKVLRKHELHEGEYRDCWLMAIDRILSKEKTGPGSACQG